MAKRKKRAKREQVTGVGGVFFKARDPEGFGRLVRQAPGNFGAGRTRGFFMAGKKEPQADGAHGLVSFSGGHRFTSVLRPKGS